MTQLHISRDTMVKTINDGMAIFIQFSSGYLRDMKLGNNNSVFSMPLILPVTRN
jgi:hypothetical protein